MLDYFTLDYFTLLLFLTAFLSAAIAAVTGFGIGSLLTPLLSLRMNLKLAVALVSLPHFAATFLRFFILRKKVDRSVLISFGLASAFGGLLGAYFHNLCNDPALIYVFSGLLVIAGLSGVFGLSEKIHLSQLAGFIAGFLSGGFGGMVGNQGGIRSAALLSFKLSKEAFVATATATGVIVDLARMPVYVYYQGSQMQANLELVLLMTVGTISGTFFGKSILSKIPEAIFRKTVSALVGLLGVFMAARQLMQ